MIHIPPGLKVRIREAKVKNSPWRDYTTEFVMHGKRIGGVGGEAVLKSKGFLIKTRWTDIAARNRELYPDGRPPGTQHLAPVRQDGRPCSCGLKCDCR